MLTLLGMNLIEMTAEVQRAGFAAFRAKQLFHWLYQKGAASFEEMANLPSDFRGWLRDHARVGGVEAAETRAAPDGTMKILWRLADGEHVEGVLMPEDERWTLCVSSQVGCPLGCRFCVTGSGGIRRDCAANEIIGQVLRARAILGGRGQTLTNLVFMGMGEPLLNLDAVIRALRLLISPQALKISSRRITVSTAGIIEGIRRLSEARLNVKLAVSLNATDDGLRRKLMPIAKSNPLPELLEACRQFQTQSPNRHRVTFEYVLLDGVNDSLDHARALSRLVSAVPCKINLIPFNPDARLPYGRPPQARVEAFRDLLLEKSFTVAIRYSKGLEVSAACGQLALRGRQDAAGGQNA